MLEKVRRHDEWEKFYIYKLEKGYLNKKEEQELKDFVNNKTYLNIAREIENYQFSYPKKSVISKMGNAKKRIVYQYKKDENYILKFISHKLYKYDNIFSDNLYSYRKNTGVKKAIKKLFNTNLNIMYGYKLDISNYFNSIDTDILLSKLKEVINDDYDLYKLLEQIISNPYVEYKDSIIMEKKGAMGGVPISAFLANVYLKDVDKKFLGNDVLYFRYADDILILSSKIESLRKYINILKEALIEHKLTINTDKEMYFYPGEEIEFLGFSIKNGIIDLSSNTIKKIKGKIKRSARGIRRWMLRKNTMGDYALKAMNNKFNHKFYVIKNKNDLNWSRWFFPIINTSRSLKVIDNYMQENLRYIICGRYCKKNYEKVPYKKLKECHYKPLVHEYYKNVVYK